jgi:hypothetical protein
VRFGTWNVRTLYRAGSLMGWIDVVQNRDRWPALANAVMNLRVP